MHSSIKFICINVKSSVKRRAHMQQQAEEYNIPLDFFKAITPQTLDTVPNTYTDFKARMWWRRALLPTEIACGLSHIAIWREFLASSYEYLVVFEDDVHINPDFMSVINAIDKLSQKYDFIKLSGQHDRFRKLAEHMPFKNYKLLLNTYGTLDAGCYYINKKAAKKMLDYCQSLHMAIDVLMDRSYDHGVAYYTVDPYPVYTHWQETGDLKSDIGTQDRKLKSDHHNIFLTVIFKLLRFYTSYCRRIAALKLYFS